MLQIGDKAPDFESKDQNEKAIKLSDFMGKKVLLFFYPKDNTSGCTAQACDLRDNHELLQQNGYIVLGVSSDNEKSHRKFIETQNLPFTLIADTDKHVHELYETWKEKKMYGKTYMGTARTTFLIDQQGIITNIIAKVNTKEHTKQVLG